ncbi:MAG TPA: hypothetical protein PKA41_02715 [Verrucomicrobiota bacterium]|nr:hypothetical protein [Verrucomicrobiota bacterium]
MSIAILNSDGNSGFQPGMLPDVCSVCLETAHWHMKGDLKAVRVWL